MKFVNSDTFRGGEVEVEDYLYNLAKDIKNAVSGAKYEHERKIATVAELMVSDKGESNKLIFGIMKNRKVGEPAEKYKITIEKISE